MKKLIAMLLCFAMVAAFGASAAFASPNYNAAYQRIRWAYGNRDFSDHVLSPAESALTKLITYVKAYEAVKFDSSKSTDQVNTAKDKLQGQLDALYAENEDLVEPLVSMYKEEYRDDARKAIEALFNADTATSTNATAWKSNIQTMDAQNLLWADKYEIQADYFLSERTKMDYNALVIGQEQLNAAYNLERAEKSAATAKASALKAQATAKALIADTIKTAQDAAATAVANAQASAYKQLSDSYADAVEAFWAEVENAWF